MSRYVRMVIGEALSEGQLQEFSRIYNADVLPTLPNETGFVSASLLTEESGNMAVHQTIWETREDCLRYHSSRSYRLFVSKTLHLLAGQFVIKIFREDSTGRPAPKENFILIQGNPVDGFTYTGPYVDSTEATEDGSADGGAENQDWWVAPLNPVVSK